MILRRLDLPFSVCHFSFVIARTASSRNDKWKIKRHGAAEFFLQCLKLSRSISPLLRAPKVKITSNEFGVDALHPCIPHGLLQQPAREKSTCSPNCFRLQEKRIRSPHHLELK